MEGTDEVLLIDLGVWHISAFLLWKDVCVHTHRHIQRHMNSSRGMLFNKKFTKTCTIFYLNEVNSLVTF